VLRCLNRLLLFALLLTAVVGATQDARAQGQFISPGPLSMDHSDLDNNCFACHSVSRGVDETLCMGCHDSVRNQVATNLGFHADKGNKCESCHHEHWGRDAPKLMPKVEEDPDFDHATTGFELKGAHADAACADCHTEPGTYTGLRSACESCHDDPHGMDDSKRDLLKSCDTCHNEIEWKALPIPAFVFDHTSGAQTDYVLEGKHIDVYCADCHFDWRFVPVEHDRCEDCHQDPHRADFGNDTCEDCHPNPGSWTVPKFDHDRTPYPLEGQHAKVPECFDCHKGNATLPLQFGSCENCHGDVHKGQFQPKPCDDCHTVQIPGFSMDGFDHDITDFPLVGLHENATCESCHGKGDQAVYVGRPFDDCDACHVDEHEGRFEPTLCQRCHTPEGFKALFFNHDDTNFPHTGKHKEAECNACHTDFQWIGFAYGSCADCHQDESPHDPGILGPETCDSCHDTVAFADVTFDHLANTRFDLAPAHTENKCADCHESVDVFSGLNSDCVACHKSDRPWGHYDGACGDCHQAANWFPGGLGNEDHSVTGFSLKGQHAVLECESCHLPGVPRGAANPQCASCHAEDDSHKNLLGNVCEDCHSDYSWFRVRWRHGTTGWPLRGGHRLAECIDCHPNSYTGTPNQCFRCHSGEASNGEHHQSAVFRDCELCHREYSWTPPIYSSFGASGLGQ
jgi:hypothetical protein